MIKQDIVTPEWLSDLCLTLDGEETSVTNDRVKQNALIQNTSNPHYQQLRLESLEDYDPYTKEVEEEEEVEDDY